MKQYKTTNTISSAQLFMMCSIEHGSVIGLDDSEWCFQWGGHVKVASNWHRFPLTAYHLPYVNNRTLWSWTIYNEDNCKSIQDQRYLTIVKKKKLKICLRLKSQYAAFTVQAKLRNVFVDNCYIDIFHLSIACSSAYIFNFCLYFTIEILSNSFNSTLMYPLKSRQETHSCHRLKEIALLGLRLDTSRPILKKTAFIVFVG